MENQKLKERLTELGIEFKSGPATLCNLCGENHKPVFCLGCVLNGKVDCCPGEGNICLDCFRKTVPLAMDIFRDEYREKLAAVIYGREQADKIMKALGAGQRESAVRRFVGNGQFSSGRIETIGPHDKVRIWNRGGLAGELVLNKGDGEPMLRALGMLEKEEGDE